MKLALVSSFITTFSFFCACCHVFCHSFARSGAPAVPTHTDAYVHHIDTYRQRKREVEGDTCVLFACLRCVIIFFVGSTPPSPHIFFYPIYCMSISHICIVMDFFRFLSIRIWVYIVVYIAVHMRVCGYSGRQTSINRISFVVFFILFCVLMFVCMKIPLEIFPLAHT